MSRATEHFDLLGLTVRDRVTRLDGVVTSVAFDLFGCIQALLSPPVDSTGNKPECWWADVSRLEILNTEPVMDRPSYEYTPEDVAKGLHGPADKPIPRIG